MRTSEKILRILRWLLNLSIFAVIPAFLIFYGFTRISELKSTEKLQAVEQKIQSELQKLEALGKTESFLAQSLWKAFYGSDHPSTVEDIKILRAKLNNKFDYIAWNSFGKVVDQTIDPAQFAGDWAKWLNTVKKIMGLKSKNLVLSSDEERNFKILFGPQFFPDRVKDCRSNSNESLIWTDSTGKKPVLWVGATSKLSIVVLIKPEFLNVNLGLDFHIANFPKQPFAIGYSAKDTIKTSSQLPDQDEARKKLSEKLTLDQLSFSTPSARFYRRILDENQIVFAFFKNQTIQSTDVVSPWAATAFFLILLIPYLIFSYKIIVLHEKIRFSITLKLSLLFIFSGGLPLAILFFVGYDYLNQKEFALLDEVHEQGTRYLQNFDERFESENAYRIVLIQSALDQYLPILKKDGIRPETYFPLVAKICKDLQSLSEIQIFLIASNSKFLGTEKSVKMDQEVFRLVNENKSAADQKQDKEAAKIYSSIGKFIIDGVNGNPVDERVSTEVELLAESAMQKTLHELQQEFISSDGKLTIFGLGSRKSPTYVDLLSVSDNGKYDYLLLVLWNINTLDTMYLNRQFLNANRNMQNLKILASCEESGKFFPDKLVLDTGLRAYVDKFSQKPHPARQFIEVDHEKNLIMGFKGKFMRNFSLFALYPVKEIEKRIYAETQSLITAGIFSILIILVLGHLLSKSFILPLKIISDGAEAIRKKDFDVRLPIPGNDEFGEIAKVFNETMVDLEELKVAGIVQEQLLPKILPETGNFKIFGKSVSMGDVGGDYYDFFNSSENHFSVLIGDVSGHGVGAALIMAMAKAGILHSEDFLDKPTELTHRMHNLIRSARSAGQKRFMSFQYVYLNALEGSGIYANAGGWPPLIVNPETRKITELKLSGPLLGALNRPIYQELEFKMQPGEALILYTDGIIEATDPTGKMLGFNHFCDLVIEAQDKDPQKYYENIILAYRNFIGKTETSSDDLTMLVLVFS